MEHCFVRQGSNGIDGNLLSGCCISLGVAVRRRKLHASNSKRGKRPFSIPVRRGGGGNVVAFGLRQYKPVRTEHETCKAFALARVVPVGRIGSLLVLFVALLAGDRHYKADRLLSLDDMAA